MVYHEFTAGCAGVDADHIARLAAVDWGLWRTLGMVAERSEAFAAELAGFGAAARVTERLRSILDAAPKSRGLEASSTGRGA